MERPLGTFWDNPEPLVKQRTTEMRQANRTRMNAVAEREKVEPELPFTRFAFDHASEPVIPFDRQDRYRG
jgi:hypothetical protein